MNANPPKTFPATSITEPQELENQIRLRVYEIYEARGQEDGHDIAEPRFALRVQRNAAGRFSVDTATTIT